jgi:hypothetical protein
MFRLLTPVPGRDIDPSTPDSRALSVSWKGPSLNDLVYDLIPFSVMLYQRSRSKLMGDLGLGRDPSCKDLVYDLIPFSVMLTPGSNGVPVEILMDDFFVMYKSTDLFGLFEIIFIHLGMNVFNHFIISG